LRAREEAVTLAPRTAADGSQDREEPSPKSGRATFALACSYGLAIAATLASVDCAGALTRASFATRADAARLCFAIFVTLLSLGAASSALGTVWSAGLRRFTARYRLKPSMSLRAIGMGLPFAAIGPWLLGTWLHGSWRRLPRTDRWLCVAGVVALYGVAALVAVLLFLPNERKVGARLRFLVVAVSVLVALSSFGAERALPAVIYPHFHNLFVLHGAMACAVAVRWLGRSMPWDFSHERTTLAIAGGALLALAVLDGFNAHPVGAKASFLYGRVVSLLRGATDFDGDGSSSLLGGRDCKPFDAAFAPCRFDVPENGLDEDCSGTDARLPREEPRRPYSVPNRRGDNVVWLSIDALRPDHIGAYGYSRRTTPNIDSLATSGFRFSSAHAQATGTWDSVPSMLTGRYPHSLPRDYDDPRAAPGKRWYAYTLKPEAPLVSELLARIGYATGGFGAPGLFDWLGFDQRFATYERTDDYRGPAVRFVSTANEPFFLWEHMPYPHEPYEKHAEHDFGPGKIDRYDSEIAFSDSIIGDIVRALERRGALGRTIVIITADHGEAFGEHNSLFHASSCYEEQMRVPLVLRVPGSAPAVVSTPVELVDLVPTLLELLGIPRQGLALDGESLLDAMANPERRATRGAYCEYFQAGPTLKSLISGKYKLVYDVANDELELFALDRDPGERVNLEREEPRARERLLDALGERSHPQAAGWGQP
jgi:arylsulfatase A-like enzyme